jgi:hypothetical protein
VDAQRQAILDNPERVAAYAASTSSVYLDNVRRMLMRCQDAQVPCVGFLQPSRDVASPADATDRNPLVTASYDRIRAGLPSDLPFIDLTMLLPPSDRFFVDKVHFTDAGHEAVARAVLQPVLSALQTTARAR